jgi:hypothetical protein
MSKSHPEYHLVALVRNKDQAKAITDIYPSVETVLADLDNDSVLRSEASKADVVLSK